MDTVTDRVETAVRNIMSGSNACGTLKAAVEKGNADYFREMIEPILQVYEDEADDLRKQRDDALVDAEAKRQALEIILSNVTIDNPVVLSAIRKALPGRAI